MEDGADPLADGNPLSHVNIDRGSKGEGVAAAGKKGSIRGGGRRNLGLSFSTNFFSMFQRYPSIETLLS